MNRIREGSAANAMSCLDSRAFQIWLMTVIFCPLGNLPSLYWPRNITGHVIPRQDAPFLRVLLLFHTPIAPGGCSAENRSNAQFNLLCSSADACADRVFIYLLLPRAMSQTYKSSLKFTSKSHQTTSLPSLTNTNINTSKHSPYQPYSQHLLLYYFTTHPFHIYHHDLPFDFPCLGFCFYLPFVH